MGSVAAFSILVACSVLFYGSEASDLANPGENSQISNELTHKRPVWMKTSPLRRLKPLNSYSLYRREMQPSDVEFIDDSYNTVEKKFDDYGHMRFGKRGGGEGDGFDDYGHMRFGRR